ncbi:MAG: hypothetical protein LC793_01490 [Thermomicrobia bacterium]|nr:hypothetical protein [Thermomicrobia bacterium]
MRLIWINTLLCIAVIVFAASIYRGAADSVRLVFSLIIVALGIYRLADIVRE